MNNKIELSLEDLINIRLGLTELINVEEDMAMSLRARQRFNLFSAAKNDIEATKRTLNKIRQAIAISTSV